MARLVTIALTSLTVVVLMSSALTQTPRMPTVSQVPAVEKPTQMARPLFAILQNNKIGYIDRRGTIAIKPQFGTRLYRSYSVSDAEEFAFQNGLALVKVGRQFGYINPAGRIAIKPQFADAKPFHENLTAVKVGDRWGFIDATGKRVIPPAFQSVENFSEGLAQVWSGDKYRFADRAGRVVIDPGFSVLNNSHFSDGLAVVLTVEQTSGFIDKTGTFVIPPKLVGAGHFSEGLASVIVGNKRGFIDKTGRVAIAPTFDEVGHGFSEGLATARVDGKWGYIDKTGTWTIAPQFQQAQSFSQGLARVAVSIDENNPLGKIGYIDKTGKRVISPQFADASDFRGDLAAVVTGFDNGWSYVDRTGKLVWQRLAEYRHASRTFWGCLS
ncbi:WG repeat-containing protein [Leptolyngbya sp. FACHB-36]|uniref:WG repeat-containing protein n=1 Tax=Leptolyngbya sp. FACHB-36 TaxID=2692808 RepID=UPI001A7EA0B4|nr:WG repeat-containing protein [Leptolyngbya sp. FACHB-36]